MKLREKTAPTFDGHLAHVGAWFDERVMRMGFGELAAVKTLRESGIKVSTVPGWRTGLLIVDDEFYLFTPTALYLEAEPKGLVESNGVRLAPGYVKARRFGTFLLVPRYFFDTGDGELIRDEIGIVLEGIAAARDEATRGLADFARDALPGSVRRELAVEVRDQTDLQVLTASLWFEVAGVMA